MRRSRICSRPIPRFALCVPVLTAGLSPGAIEQHQRAARRSSSAVSSPTRWPISTPWCSRTRSACASPARTFTPTASAWPIVRPSECLFIDDLPANIEAAQACGWQGIVYQRRTATCAASLRKLGVEVPSAVSEEIEVDMNPIEQSDPEVWQAIAGERRRQQHGLEMIASENYTSPAVHGRPGLGADQQVRRGLSRPALLRRLRVRRRRRAPGHRAGAASSSAPSTPTSSRTPAPRPTWPSTSPAWSRATPSWPWTWPTAAI